MSTSKPNEKPRYRVPALDKGLDILELIAEESEGLTQSQIAQRLKRSPDELFRIIVCLENRGYLYRMKPGDTFHLTSQLFVLAHKHPPTQRLIDAALPMMRELSRRNMQSCHLSIPTAEGLLVVAQVDAPECLGFAVRQGTLLDATTTTSGLVFQAFSSEVSKPLSPSLKKIQKAKCLKRPSAMVKGITDIAAPILDHRGAGVAVLNIPYVSFLEEAVSVTKVLDDVRITAAQLSATQGGLA